LLHLGSQLLPPLLIFGISPRLRRLLRLKAGDLLRIRGRGTHRQGALRRGSLFAAHEARYIREPYKTDDHDKRNDDGRALLYRPYGFTLRRDGSGWVGILVGHGYFFSSLRWKSTRFLPIAK
jgi:hypothetical protein